MTIANMLSVAGLLLACALAAEGASFTKANLFEPGGVAPADSTYTFFTGVLANATAVSADFYTDAVKGRPFKGSILAPSDAAFESLATWLGYGSASAMFASGDLDANLLNDIVRLHILPDLMGDTVVQNGDILKSLGRLGVSVAQESGDKLSFLPSLSVAAITSDANDADTNTTNTGSSNSTANSTESSDSSSGRRLLSAATSRALEVKTVQGTNKGGNNLGFKQVIYVDHVLIPVSVMYLKASTADSVYAAIAAIPILSNMKTLLDSSSEAKAVYAGKEANSTSRRSLQATAFTGTVFAPHDDAFAYLFQTVGVASASEFAAQYPDVVTNLLLYQTLPDKALDFGSLTRKGKGLQCGAQLRCGGPPEDKGKPDGVGRGRPDSVGGGSGSEGAANGNGRRGPPPGVGNSRGGGAAASEGDSDSSGARRALLQEGEDVENRFKSGRPGRTLKIVKTGSGKVKVVGPASNANFLAPTSQISLNGGKAFVHIIDNVLRFSAIVSAKQKQDANAFFSGSTGFAPANQTYTDLLKVLNITGLPNLLTDIKNTTFVAPSDAAWDDMVVSRGITKAQLFDNSVDSAFNSTALLLEIMNNHLIEWASSQPLEDKLYSTVAGRQVNITQFEDGYTFDFVSNSTSSRRMLLSTRGLLQSGRGASTEGNTVDIGDGSQVMFSNAVLMDSSSNTGMQTLETTLSTTSGSRQLAPCLATLAALLAASLVALAGATW